MLTLIDDLKDAHGARGEIRAGGTDLHDRYHLGVSAGPVLDVHKLAAQYSGFKQAEDGTTTIGALASVYEVGQHPITASQYAALAKAASGLATPQIRYAATFAGGLLQRTRCWYYRHPDLPCTKKGDAVCGGRTGQHPNGVIFDQGGCAHAHPSTLATALLAYEAVVRTTERELSIEDLYGDGADHSRDHLLNQNEILTHVILPPPVESEKTAYLRAISRFEAEWPIVECTVRLLVEGGSLTMARVGVGGVSQIPLRLKNVEAALEGHAATQETLEHAAQVSADGANPLSQAAWKVDILTGTLLSTLELALADHESGV